MMSCNESDVLKGIEEKVYPLNRQQMHARAENKVQRQSNEVQKSKLTAGSPAWGLQNDYMHVIFGP
jgi:hypothetical protein